MANRRTVLHQRADWHAAVLLGRSSGWMNIGQPSHGRRPLVEHGWPSGARVLRYPTAGSHHSYGVDSITRRFRADGIMKVFFNDCQASNQYGLTTQRSDRGDRELRDAKKSGKCPHAGLHCSPRHTGIVCLCEPRLVLSKRIKQSKRPKKIKESNTTSIPLIPSHSKMKSKQSKSRDNPGKSGSGTLSSAPGSCETSPARPASTLHSHRLGRMLDGKLCVADKALKKPRAYGNVVKP